MAHQLRYSISISGKELKEPKSPIPIPVPRHSPSSVPSSETLRWQEHNLSLVQARAITASSEMVNLYSLPFSSLPMN